MSHSSQKFRARLLFTESGQPVQGLNVRAETGEELKTDEKGQVEVAFADTRQKLEVFRGGKWTPHVVDGSPDTSLIIVDLARRDTREMKALKPETSFLDIGKLNLGDRYSYHEVLGRGGMSIVIRARDRLLHRDVAIKVLSQELSADTEAQSLFLTEARNLATLTHPNLVAVHDICKVDDQVFIVIEYVEGVSLEKLIAGVKGLSEQSALRTMVQLARVVSYMHNRGVIHRDLKPSNALIREDGTLKLIDFGLARRFDDLYIRGTRVRGTPAYMSPEQFKGDPLTAACDIYMFGVCLFQVLTGELPFAKGDMGYAHVHEEAPRVDEFNPSISKELADLVADCLEKRPSDRPGDGEELLRRLQSIYKHAGGKPASTDTLDKLGRVDPDASSELLAISDSGETVEVDLSETVAREAAALDEESSDVSEDVSVDISSDPEQADESEATEMARSTDPAAEEEQETSALSDSKTVTAEKVAAAAAKTTPATKNQTQATAWTPIVATSLLSAGIAVVAMMALTPEPKTVEPVQKATPPAVEKGPALTTTVETVPAVPVLPTELDPAVVQTTSELVEDAVVAAIAERPAVETTPTEAPANPVDATGGSTSETSGTQEGVASGEAPAAAPDTEGSGSVDTEGTTSKPEETATQSKPEKETTPSESEGSNESERTAPPADSARKIRKTKSGFLKPL